MNHNIRIVPFFDQGRQLWRNWTHIKNYTYYIKYGDVPSNVQGRVNGFERNWNQDYCFALGAFDNMKMIGFANGAFLNGPGSFHFNLDEHISDIVVLPKYQGLHIGTDLLNRMVDILSFSQSYINLGATDGSAAFYTHNGFTDVSSYYARLLFRKDTQPPINKVIPMFYGKDNKPKKSFARPHFVYVDDTATIAGEIYQPNTPLIVGRENNKISTELNREMNNFLEIQNNKIISFQSPQNIYHQR